MAIINSSKKSTIIGLGIIAFFAMSISSLSSVTVYTSKAMEICARQVVPSLFFFLVLTGTILRMSLHTKIPSFISEPICRAFNISPSSVSAFVFGLLCGFPIGGKIAVDLLKRQEIDREEAERLIAFSNNTGPAFTIAAVGTAILGNTYAGVAIYFLQIISAVCVALFLRKDENSHKLNQYTIPSEPFFEALCGAIYDAAASCVSICGFIIFFYTAIGVVSDHFPIYEVKLLLSLLGEVSSGANAAASLPVPFSFSAAAFSVGWSGISVHMQTLRFVSDTDINMKKYYISKMFCGLFCGTGMFLLSNIITAYNNQVIATQLPPGIGYFLMIFAILIIFIGFIISKLEKSKEI